MTDNVSFLGVGLKNRTVLASGILGVTLSSLRRVYREGAGLVTTKSVGPEKRKGHAAPVLFDWGKGFINSVGLSNPGIEDFVLQYDNNTVDFPLAISIFGKTPEDYPELARKLRKLAFTFIELNLSCPNVHDEFGTPFSFSVDHTFEITRGVKEVIDKPVIVKLSPNTAEMIKIARSAEEAGADALCVMNSAGPGMIIDPAVAFPLLGNEAGGISGDALLPLTVRRVYEIYREVSIPIIGTGGISDVNGALQVLMAGATLCGIGSALSTRGFGVFHEITEGIHTFLEKNRISCSEELIGLSHKKKKVYFSLGLPEEEQRPKGRFCVLPVEEVLQNSREIKTLFFDAGGMKRPEPGQFFMLWIPGRDQKPYSISYYDGNRIGFSFVKKGAFSSSLYDLEKGYPVGLLGPLGRRFDLRHHNYLLVGGGIGLAPLVFASHTLWKQGKQAHLFAGGKRRDSVSWIIDLLNREEKKQTLKASYCTEDGSLGYRGMLTEHLQEMIDDVRPDFILLCGPELCIKRSIEICVKNGIRGEASIERIMKCGIGMCGSCSLDPHGDRVCVEGPVFPFHYLHTNEEFGRYGRDESGTIQRIN